jgi:hypothetical protein
MATVFTIDRFEGSKKEIAVLLSEDERTVEIPRWLLPKDAKAGDVFNVKFEHDSAATTKVAAATKKIQADLAKGDDGGDLNL